MHLDSLKLNPRAHLAIIALAGIVLCLPVVLYGFPAYSHDGWIHALWSANFSNQFWAGDLYPRWLAGLNRGMGSPTFFFYPPLSYYLTSFFRLFFSPDTQGWQPLGFSALVAVIAAGACVYLWLRRIVGDGVACAAAVFYTALPYHLIIDLYIRGALAELFAFVWMPLALYFIFKFQDRPRLALIGLAASYGLLIISHLPTALIFTPLPLACAWFTAEPAGRKQRVVLVLSSLGLGAGLSAIYLLPAVAMRKFVSIQEMQKGVTNYENWFLFSGFSPRELNAQITLITLVTLALAVCFFAVAVRTQDKRFRRESSFWLWVSLLAFLMMTPASRPLWKLLPLLQSIQFPFRFNTILAVASTALFALAMESAKAANARMKLLGRIAAVVGLLLFLVATVAYGWRQYKIHGQLIAAENGLVKNNMDAPEYRPRWASRDSLPSNSVSVVEGEAEVSIGLRQASKIILNVNAVRPATVDVPQFYFPGWQWRLGGTGGFHDSQPSPQAGLVRIVIPEGRHLVEVKLNATWPERGGQVISAFCCAVLILIGIRRRRY
ncbi:MAG: 6-pyruvoyl-tetrahydropterin synthase-related protein [Acidobacteriota bacterium]